MALRKPNKGSENGAAHGYVAEEDSFYRSFPTVADFLRQDRWEDGSRRTPGVLMLLMDQGWCKAWVHDKDAKRAAWVSATTFAGLLEAVESGIQEDSLEWRPDRKQGGR